MTAMQANAADVNKIIKKVQKTYDKMDNLSATFKQVETFKITGSQTETSGKIFIKNGVKYRFKSEDQVIVTDGKTIWTYNEMSKQLLIDNVRENSGALLPRDLLFKYPKKYYSTLLGEEKSGKNEVYKIRLDPKEDVHGYIKSVKLWIDKDNWYILMIETTDLNGNQSRFEITDIDTKSKLSDDLFTYQADDSVNVVDMR
jgi:chaperone LolA